MRKDDRVILVEGYMDAIGVTAAGFRNVVASCGTALTDEQVQARETALAPHRRQLRSGRRRAPTPPNAPSICCSPKACRCASWNSMAVSIPTSTARSAAPTAYQERLDGAKGYFYWLADRARAKHDMRTSEGKVAVLNFLLPKVQRISDQLERMTIANDVAGYLGVERRAWCSTISARRSPSAARSHPSGPKSPLRHDERMLLIASVDAMRRLRAEMIEQMKITGDHRTRCPRAASFRPSSRWTMRAAAWASTRSTRAWKKPTRTCWRRPC